MKRILVVDDQPEIRELVSVTLEDSTYEILTACNGREALEIAQAELPELILLDIVMPGGLDGIEVCRRLKNDARTQHIFIIILTSQGQAQDREAGYDAGADEFFVKPFSPLALMRKVDEVLNTPAR